jgi:hypothetical protein
MGRHGCFRLASRAEPGEKPNDAGSDRRVATAMIVECVLVLQLIVE